MQTHYRITTEAHPEDSSVVLLLGGKFDEDALPDLGRSISQARGAHMRITLDLSEVTLVDRTTVKYFSEQAGEDLELVNCPRYLRRWIKQVSDEPEN